MQLTLKVGAQVMITKNIPEKGLINGMMGIIEEMGREVIAIKIRRESGNSELVTIKESGWTQFKHVFNREKRQIDPKEIGTFFQFPLKLGWAITVHKSQGLTLPAATISIDRAFACGQIYVALSRVRRLKDLSFSKPLRIHDVQCDSRVTHFLNSRVDYKLGVG